MVSLLKGGAGGVGSDAELEEAYNNCGDHYAELNRWPEAMPYYEKVRKALSPVAKLTLC